MRLHKRNPIEGFVAALVFDGLLRATPDGKLAPALAVAVPSAANGGISRDGTNGQDFMLHNWR